MTTLYIVGLIAAAIVGAIVGIWAWVHWTLYQIWRDS